MNLVAIAILAVLPFELLIFWYVFDGTYERRLGCWTGRL